MRSRTIREGSVGLLILLGVGVFAGLILWIRNISVGSRSYKIIVEFANAGGMQVGGVVRYRGVNVGKISSIKPSANGVDVELEISPADLVMSREVTIEASQSGLIGEIFIDIKPQKNVPDEAIKSKPLSANCPEELIICNNSRMPGNVGVSFKEVLGSTANLANAYSDPALVANLNIATRNAADAAAAMAQLTRELTLLGRTSQKQLVNFSIAAESLTRTADRTASQFGLTANQISATASQFGLTANQISTTAQQYGSTADQLTFLLARNQDSIAAMIGNLSRTTGEMEAIVSSFTPVAKQFGQGKLLANLEAVSSDLRTLSSSLTSLNTQENVVVLQKTLDSARVTFENVQKITSDLDQLTGDPVFRNNIRNLVNGLSSLVSTTQQIDKQVQIAQELEPLKQQINLRLPVVIPPSSPKPVPELTYFPTAIPTPSTIAIQRSLAIKSDKDKSDRDRIRFKPMLRPTHPPLATEFNLPSDSPSTTPELHPENPKN